MGETRRIEDIGNRIEEPVVVRQFAHGRLIGVVGAHHRVWVNPERIASITPVVASQTLMDRPGTCVEYIGGGWFESPVDAETIARAWLGEPAEPETDPVDSGR